ncbi:MAG: PilZ domain-containing protein [Candidatus Acidiferrales bacterium]
MDHFVDRFVRDRRLATRHNLRTPLRFRIRKSSIPEQRAETENLSERGVFFATKSPISVGTAVELLLKMPEEITGKRTSEWRCTGHVVRVEPQVSPEEQLGVGVEFDFYEISQA